MDLNALLTIIFCNQRDDLYFVFKFRKISKVCKNISEYWLTELFDSKFLRNVKITQFKNLRKLQCDNNIIDNDLQQLKFLTKLEINRNISDNGIKHLHLKTLYIQCNCILSKEIAHIHLYTFNTTDVEKILTNGTMKFKITNNGIKDSDLHVLYINGYLKISKMGFYKSNSKLIK